MSTPFLPHQPAASGRRPGPTQLALGLAALATTVLAACASAPAPNEQLAVGKAAVERANGSTGADASITLASARSKLEQAQAAQAANKPVLASQLAEQAEADAVLAEAQARSVRSARALAEVREGLRVLRLELNRP